MNARVVLYALWCIGVAVLFVVCAGYAWSPFAEGSRARTHAGFYGPTHK